MGSVLLHKRTYDWRGPPLIGNPATAPQEATFLQPVAWEAKASPPRRHTATQLLHVHPVVSRSCTQSWESGGGINVTLG